MDLNDYNFLSKLLNRHGFTFSKSLGQNFLIDPDVCPRMAENLNADEKTGVLEIGPGVGVLTKELALVSKKVVSIELDKRLFPILDETLAEHDNVDIVYGDVMKLDLHSLLEEKFSDVSKIKVCANLPYYITSPVIMTLLESKLPIDEIIVMVQKEAAERLCADVGSRASGAVTVAVQYYSKAQILFDVMRDSFYPSPKVDSAVISLKLRQTPPVIVKNEKAFFRFVKAAFAQRRKTLVNSVSNTSNIPKQSVIDALSKIGIENNIRAEKLSMEEFALISDMLDM